MSESITRLKNYGYNPSLILDIGSNVGAWTQSCLKIFPSPRYVMFDGNKFEFSKLPSNVTNIQCILSDKIKNVKWFKKHGTGDSIYKERTAFYDDCEVLELETIDLPSCLLLNDIQINSMENILIKLDVQGSEKDILSGCSKEFLNKVDFIVCEIPFFGKYNEINLTFLDFISFMDSINFIPFDLDGIHRLREGFVIQVDILFIRKDHVLGDKIDEIIKHLK